MSRKMTRRRHYPLLNPIKHAIEGACITPPGLLDQLETRELSAIECFAQGRATTQEWYDMAALLGMCQTMAQSGIGPEALETCARADAAIDDAMVRFNTTGRMGSTGPGLQAFRDLLEYHQLQRRAVPRSVYEAMMRKTVTKVRHMRGVINRNKELSP